MSPAWPHAVSACASHSVGARHPGDPVVFSESTNGAPRTFRERTQAHARIDGGWRQKGVVLTVDSAGAVTVTDDKVQAVSSVDLHDREMVRSSPQHRESRKIGSVQELTEEGGLAATRHRRPAALRTGLDGIGS
jgi:hypothetical protein